MNTNTYTELNPLDKIRLTQGKEKLRTYFQKLCKKQPEKALKHINDKRLHFASLFLLFPEIEAFKLYEKLDKRNITAIKMCLIIGKMQKFEPAFEEAHDELYPVLKWMLVTGADADGESDQYDGIMDAAASLLTRSYLDKTVLPVIEKMIFKRYSSGKYIHDLVWAFFQIRDIDALKLTARHLRSTEPKQAEFACRLLNLPYSKGNSRSAERQRQYAEYMSWLRENEKHIYFTGESFNMTSYPKHCSVDLAAKYLCREISHFDRKPLLPFTEQDSRLLEQFESLNQEEKQTLSSYSYKLHKKSSGRWNKWLQRPLDEQLDNAQNGRGAKQ